VTDLDAALGMPTSSASTARRRRKPSDVQRGAVEADEADGLSDQHARGGIVEKQRSMMR